MKIFLIAFLLLPFLVAPQNGKKINMEIDSLFQTYFNPGEPGGAVLLVKDGKIV